MFRSVCTKKLDATEKKATKSKLDMWFPVLVVDQLAVKL